MLADHFPEMDSLIDTTHASINHMNDFILINISNSPMNMIKAGISTGAFLMVLGAILVPVLAALTQWLNFKMMPQQSAGDSNMDNTMKSMNMMMKYVFPLSILVHEHDDAAHVCMVLSHSSCWYGSVLDHGCCCKRYSAVGYQ